MTKTIKIILIAAILLGLVAISVLLIKRGESKILYKVPQKSVSVLVINVPALSAKLFFDQIGRDTGFSARLKKLVPDTLKDIDWATNGLKVFDKLTLFTIEDTATASVSLNFIIQISSADKFNRFMDSLSKKLNFVIDKRTKDNIAFSKSLSLLLVWNNNFVTGMITKANNDKNIELLTGILSTRKEQSIMTDPLFEKSLAGHYDILLYSRPYQKSPDKKLEMINSNVEYIASDIIFNNGELDIITEAKTKKGSIVDKLFTNTNKDLSCLAKTDSAIVNFKLSLNPVAFKQLYKNYNTFEFKINGMPYPEAWDGRLNLAFNGAKTIENEYITYEYDDNFNKVAIKKVKQDKTLDLQAVAGTYETVMNSLFKLYPPIKKGNDTLLFKDGNYILTKKGTVYITYNKHFSKPGLEQRLSKNNIDIDVNYKKLAPLLKDMGMDSKPGWLDSIACERVSLSVNKKENIHITGKIYFTDKAKNSFFSIFENLHPRLKLDKAR